ncbi:MAG: DUF763 domain-containing protein, partial [Polyangiales bacterium]
SADLPLHGGRVPAWLAERMAALGRVISEAIVLQYGRDELLRRLAHPFWFQSFGAVMGMDWHSSGITTSVLGALKRGLAPVQDELGIYVCGGRGKQSRKTPSELLALGDRVGLPADALVRASRLIAKVDSAAVQDGFELYLHGFVASASGRYCVVQQGMSDVHRTARRYHWLSEGLTSFVDAPHHAIDGEHTGVIVNLTDERAERARAAQLELVQLGPDRVVRELRALAGNTALPLFAAEPAPTAEAEQLPHLQLPAHHEVHASDVLLRRLHATLAAAADSGPRDFAELLLSGGVGARTVLSLALVAEVLHGAPCRFSDPARFSLAHGGKDGHPYPVPLDVYDRTLHVLKAAVSRAQLGQSDKLAAIERLDQQARALARPDDPGGPSFDAFIQQQRAAMPAWGGRTVFDDAKAKTPRARRAQRQPATKRGAQLRLKLR